MAFEKEEFRDGDSSFEVPKWRKLVEQQLKKKEHVKFKKRLEDDFFVDEEEIALKHPKTGATIRLKDDGSIEFVSGEGSGIRITDKGVDLFGKNITISGNHLNLYLKENGVVKNNKSDTGYEYDRKKGYRKTTLEEMKKQGLKGRGLDDAN